MKNLKALRLEKGLTRAQLAVMVGVSVQAVGFWETGAKNPSADKLPKLAEALGVSIDELFYEVKINRKVAV